MKKFFAVPSLLCLLVLIPGCDRSAAPEPAPEPPAAPAEPAASASATLEAKNASGVSGTARFTAEGGNVVMWLEIAGATPGEHAFHLHAVGDCSSADGKSAGGHWNPHSMDHGKLGEGEKFHYGDTGNMTVGEDGSGSATVSSSLWSIGTGEAGDVVGKSVIVHAGADDFVSQPTGAAGGRIACGVITQ